MQLCSVAQVLVVVTLPCLSPLLSTVLTLTILISVLVNGQRRGHCRFVEGGCHCGHVCKPSWLCVCCHWVLLLVVIESPVQSQSLTSRGLDQDQDWSTKAPIPQKTRLDQSKTTKN